MTRTPLAYPKIPGSSAAPLAKCFAFEKYDGTNIHWAWNFELGWHAFGTRRNRFDLDEMGIRAFHKSHVGMEGIVELFHNTLAPKLESAFKDRPAYGREDLLAFTEFYGPNSFAGKHLATDPKKLVLLDVQTGADIVPPQILLEDFGDCDLATLVYEGKLTGKFAEDVRTGKYPVFEGVVCKGGESSANLWMAKIKTNAYMHRLKQEFQDGWEAYWE